MLLSQLLCFNLLRSLRNQSKTQQAFCLYDSLNPLSIPSFVVSVLKCTTKGKDVPLKNNYKPFKKSPFMLFLLVIGTFGAGSELGAMPSLNALPQNLSKVMSELGLLFA